MIDFEHLRDHPFCPSCHGAKEQGPVLCNVCHRYESNAYGSYSHLTMVKMMELEGALAAGHKVNARTNLERLRHTRAQLRRT